MNWNLSGNKRISIREPNLNEKVIGTIRKSNRDNTNK